MASSQRTVDFIQEQLADAGFIETKRMFGEFAIYCDGKVVAFVYDDQLFVKPTKAGRAFLGTSEEGSPYPGAKPHFQIPDDRWDDAEFMTTLVKLSAAELPLPVKKPRRRK